MRYHFMYKTKDAYAETIVQFMDFKGARTVKFRLSEVKEIVDEELMKDVVEQIEKINKSPCYTGSYTKNHRREST
jgi:hypothetical protein